MIKKICLLMICLHSVSEIQTDWKQSLYRKFFNSKKISYSSIIIGSVCIATVLALVAGYRKTHASLEKWDQDIQSRDDALQKLNKLTTQFKTLDQEHQRVSQNHTTLSNAHTSLIKDHATLKQTHEAIQTRIEELTTTLKMLDRFYSVQRIRHELIQARTLKIIEKQYEKLPKSQNPKILEAFIKETYKLLNNLENKERIQYIINKGITND